MRRVMLTMLLALAASAPSSAQGEKPMLMRAPTLSKTQVAFSYGGDIWVVSRQGGEARRLTNGMGDEIGPLFSPDGSMIAFSGDYDGNRDVYVVPATGGEPRRLTYHPDADTAIAWTPDGKSILFSSHRSSPADPNKFFTVPVTGAFPTELPLPMASQGVFSPDGAKLAYVPNFQWQQAWKRYRGGQTTPIWIVNLADSRILDRIPRDNSNDFCPMWVGNTIYFLSDRNGPVSLFAYDTTTKKVAEVIHNEGLDFKFASAGPGGIIIEQFGSLHLLDLETGKVAKINVNLAGDFPALRPRFEKVDAKKIVNASISPTGQRAVFEVRGEILTVPADKGDIRNITRSPAVAERDPAWSPDGQWIAYFSDESGEYALHLRRQNGMGAVKQISLGHPPSFFYSPAWSPDSKKIAFTDKRLNAWYVDVASEKLVKVDTDYYDTPFHNLNPAWSPDSRWISYTRQLPSHLHAVFIYSLADAKTTQVTDGLSDALYADWDKSGKYLYFTASTDIGLGASWLDMSSINRPVTRNVYLMVLAKDLPSPLPHESDEEKAEEARKGGKDQPAEKEKGKEKESNRDQAKDAVKENTEITVHVDFQNIGQHILALPIPAADYLGLNAGKEGELFLLQGPQVLGSDGPTPQTLQKFTLKTRKTEKLLDGATAFVLSANGEKMLYQQGDQWTIAGTAEAPKPGEGALKLASMEVYVDPRAEWKQMYHEVWRIERDFLYDPAHHGLDLAAAEKFYAPFLDRLASRDDLNYLFTEMLGNITIGHMFINDGDMPEPKKIRGGLLGAEYSIKEGRYRFTRVYDGENWNPQLQAPLTQPGVNVVAGEYLLAVDGRELHSSDNIYSFFEDTAGRQVSIKVGPHPDGSASREVTVVPVENEAGLRHLAWIEDNRRKVDQMTGGRVAYVHLPDTAGGGYTNFNRYFFAQVGKQAAILDERFNHGGDLADYIIDELKRPLMSEVTSREGHDFSSPGGAIYGPKVMIINQFAGSGGDAMPWYFRKAGIGPLVGVRTWGGLVGIYDYPQLMDGGTVTAPRAAIYGLNGQWEVENHGIQPDVEVEMDPQSVREGHDPQLEKAVEVVLELLKKNPPPTYEKPVYPDYHQHFPPMP